MNRAETEVLDTLREVIALAQCAEDASTENHVKVTLGVVNGMLLNVQQELESEACDQPVSS